jgi:hypothetical protein
VHVKGAENVAAVRYTFVGMPGQSPTSLKEALQQNADAALIQKLFESFGPGWWLQRKPYVFRAASEYDRALPVHFVVDARTAMVENGAQRMRGTQAIHEISLKLGDIVQLDDFAKIEPRANDDGYTLIGAAANGAAPLRVRVLSESLPRLPLRARVVSTREDLLRAWLPAPLPFGDPISKLPRLLNEVINGTQSVIHGDLNLENVLVGPGGFVWLIDFARTREGHTLADFAHLEADIIAHVIAPQSSVADFIAALQHNTHPLLNAIHEIATRCLFNPSQPREWQIARALTHLGALKYANLDAHQRDLLGIAASFAARDL